MRILFLSTSFPRWQGDGFVNFVYELAASLAGKDDVTVLTPGFPGARKREAFGPVSVKRFSYFLPSGIQRVLYPEGIPAQLKKSLLAKFQAPFFMLFFWLNIIIEGRSTDIILCNWALTGYLVQKARWFVRKPCVVVVRGSDLAIMEKGGFLARLFLAALRKADAVCAVSESFVKTLQQLGVRTVHFTPNGMDYQRFKVNRAQARKEIGLDRRSTVLFVGNLVEAKGVRDLLLAMRGLDAQLIYVGDGNMLKTLKDEAREYGLDVVFPGRQPAEKLPLWYAAADVFALPSYSEGRPNVLMEAMASGCACVATDIPGSRELIGEDGGLLTPTGNAAALHDALKTVLEDRGLRERLGQAGMRRVRDVVPSWPKSVARYRGIVESLLEPARGK